MSVKQIYNSDAFESDTEYSTRPLNDAKKKVIISTDESDEESFPELGPFEIPNDVILDIEQDYNNPSDESESDTNEFENVLNYELEDEMNRLLSKKNKGKQEFTEKDNDKLTKIQWELASREVEVVSTQEPHSDWEKITKNGKVYYLNTVTQQTVSESELPNFEQIMKDGEMFYVNKTTRQTFWNIPKEWKDVKRNTKWEKYKSKSGKWYFYNVITRDSVWETDLKDFKLRQENGKLPFYFNNKTGKSFWDMPLEWNYSQKVIEEDSNTNQEVT